MGEKVTRTKHQSPRQFRPVVSLAFCYRPKEFLQYLYLLWDIQATVRPTAYQVASQTPYYTPISWLLQSKPYG